MVVGCNYSTSDQAGWQGVYSPTFALAGSTGRYLPLAPASQPIHPMQDKMNCFFLPVVAPTHLDFQGDRADQITDPTRIVFEVSVYALDARPFRGKVAFGLQDAIDVPLKGTVACRVMWEA